MKRFFLTLFLLFPLGGMAQSAVTSEQTLVVGTKLAPPFVVRDDSGNLAGISVELFRRVAERLDISYVLHETDLNGLINGLRDHSLDVSVAALTVTASREQQVDFTHPFHTTGLAIAVPRQREAIWATAGRVFSWEFVAALMALGGLLLLVGFLLWVAERRKNPEMFGGNAAQGIGSSFWWAAVTMTTVGYGDKAPATFWGRVVGLVWMFAAIILISSFTAAITTSLTVSQLSSKVQGPKDLPDVRVVSVTNSASAEYLNKRGIAFAEFADIGLAMEVLAQGQFDALVYDAPILKYFTLKDYPREIQVLPNTFVRQDYAIALPEGSDLREPLNQAILAVLREDGWREVLAAHLGDNEI